MPIYKLLVDARNVLIELDGVRAKKGFFTVCLVSAGSEQEAQKQALLLIEDRIQDSVLNNPSDPPTFEFPKIEAAPLTKLGKQAGLLWYSDVDEENRVQSRKFIEDIFAKWQ